MSTKQRYAMIECRDCMTPLEVTSASLPVCESCNIVATWYNEKTGEVYTWRTLEEYREGCEALQNQIDDAFCHQYFEEW